jgi:flagellar hook-associated protein 1
MGNLLTSLLNGANALGVYSRALESTQNNVVNASTPGYVKQTQVLEARPFDPAKGMPGGVAAGVIVSSRDQYAEQAVREQQSGLGYFNPQASNLTALETNFDLSSSSSISNALSSFFQSFSQLSVNPNDTISRHAVLDQANQVVLSFQHTAGGLQTQSADLDQQTRSTITSINSLAATIAQINAQGRIDFSGNVDAGSDAKLNSALEDLSQLAGITALYQADGTVSVYLGGQTPLVMGAQAFAIQGDFSTPQTGILGGNGKDIASQITSGQLGGLLNLKNNTIPSYLTDLNTLAQNVADQVNNALASGIDLNGSVPSTDLFTYNAANGAAQSMATSPMTPDQIAAALPGAPGGNGNALLVAALGDAKNINDYSYAQF